MVGHRNPLLQAPVRPLPSRVAVIGAGTNGPDIGYYLKSAVDDLTLQLNLTNPAPYFHTIGALWPFFPVKKEIVDKDAVPVEWLSVVRAIAEGFFRTAELTGKVRRAAPGESVVFMGVRFESVERAVNR